MLHWWLNEQCPVTSLPLGDSTSSGPRGKSPKSAHLLTYSQLSTHRPQHSTGPGTVSPPTQIERDPTCRCCDRRQLLRRSRRIPRRLARSSKGRCRGGAQVPSTRELETATTAVVGRPGRISEVLVTSSSGPNNACKATHRARLGLLWRVLSD